MNFLSPEKNMKLLKMYHTSSKAIIPLGIMSYFSYKIDNKESLKLLNTFNILNFSYHSYVSTSCVITDYIKPKRISVPIRLINANVHLLSLYGFYKYLYKTK